MTDPKVEEIRARQRKLGEDFENPDIVYLLTKLDEAEAKAARNERYRADSSALLLKAHVGANAAEERERVLIENLNKEQGRRIRVEERERVLIAGVREALALEAFRFPDYDDPERALGDPVLWQSEVAAILSRLLPSTPTEEGSSDD